MKLRKISSNKFFLTPFHEKKMELKNISEGCSYALVIKGHNRAAQIFVKIILDGPVEIFLSCLVELNYQSVLKPAMFCQF